MSLRRSGTTSTGARAGSVFDFAGKSWDQWRAMGRDQEGSVIAAPKFADADKCDFRFAFDEVIQQTGFRPFDFSQAGVYGDAASSSACCLASPI